MTNVFQVENIWRGIQSWFSLLPRITLTNIFEIIIIAFLVYEILFWIMNTRAWTLLRGLLVIGLFAVMAAIFKLTTILWLLEKTTTIAVTALVIIFQPELRKALEQMAKQEGVTEQLKAQDQMLWVRRINNIRARAEEIVREEIIYTL